MFTKIKEFLFGKDPVQSPVAAPYKVEAVAPKVELAQVAATTVTETPVPNAPAKAEAKPKAPPKPRAPRKPVAK
jgi:hypothetical protein